MMKCVKLSWFACLASLAACATPAEEDKGPNNTVGGTGGTVAGASGGGAGTAGTSSGGGSGSGGTSGGSGGSGGMSGGAGGATGGTGGTAGTVSNIMCDPAVDQPTGTCADNATGIFAIKTVIDVWWRDETSPDAPLVDPGRDTITVYLKGEITDVKCDGSGGMGLMRGCGTELPAFKSDVNCDAFQITFPDELWDNPEMPTFMTTGTTTGFEPGSILTLAEATGLIGINLTGGPEGTWPAAAMATGEYMTLDHDGDGKPGVTIKMGRIGEVFQAGTCGGFLMADFVFRGAPLEAISALDDNGEKAETLYIGVRTRIGGGGEIGATCDSGSGDSTATFLDSRVFDCVTTMGRPCVNHPDFGTAARDFVDARTPNYHILAKGEAPPATVLVPATQGGGPLDQTPSVGPRSSIVRLGDLGQTFDCAAVRNAAFTE